MTPAELKQWGADHPIQGSSPTKVMVRNTNPRRLPTDPEYIEVPATVYTSTDGSTLTVRQNDTGDYDVIGETRAPTQARDPRAALVGADAAQELREKQWNSDPNNPRGSGRWETHAERAAREKAEADAARTQATSAKSRINPTNNHF